jgi:choline-sulfatase
MADKPHVLILMTDQQRADCLSCAGHPVLKTPNMDRIAAEGVRFENAVTTCPLSMPARASFVSGLYNHNHHMWTNRGQLPADDETFFHHLQRAGYLTGYVGKSHFYEHAAGDHLRRQEGYMRARGIEHVHETTGPWATVKTGSYLTDFWGPQKWKAFQDDYERRRGTPWASWPSPLSEDDFPDSYVGRKAVEFVEGCDDGPSCLFVGFGGPHEPFDAPGRYATLYDPSACPPAIPPEPIDHLPPAAADYAAGRRAFAGDAEALDPRRVAASAANYFGKIALIDHWVGRILEAYAARGRLERLLVVLWSDHGEMLGDHGRFYKNVFYDSAVRVPLLLRWPGQLPAGAVRPHHAQTVDVFDTLLAAAGCEPSGRSLGRSLLPAARDAAAPLREAAFSEATNRQARGGFGRATMVRTQRWKYAVADTGEPLMLFDLREDPAEQRNLAGDAAAAGVRAELDRRIYEWLLETQVSM